MGIIQNGLAAFNSKNGIRLLSCKSPKPLSCKEFTENALRKHAQARKKRQNMSFFAEIVKGKGGAAALTKAEIVRK